jgi:hypothetical protein
MRERTLGNKQKLKGGRVSQLMRALGRVIWMKEDHAE